VSAQHKLVVLAVDADHPQLVRLWSAKLLIARAGRTPRVIHEAAIGREDRLDILRRPGQLLLAAVAFEDDPVSFAHDARSRRLPGRNLGQKKGKYRRQQPMSHAAISAVEQAGRRHAGYHLGMNRACS
jgi:hypothetical protein